MMFIGILANAPLPGGVPRVLFVAAATLPWQFFATTFGEVGNSLLSNSNLLTKVYFPRLIIPFGTIIVCLIDFFISLGIIILLMIYFHYPPTIRMLLIPLLLLQALFMAMGAGLFAASLNVKYRDFKFIIPFIVQFGIFVSPVAFSSDMVYNSTSLSETWKFIYSLNPMVGVIDGFRWCILGGNITLNLTGFIISVALSLFFMFAGVWYFRKTERTFADVI
jgi:lipopolysaccharide transport system permease protein